MFLRLIYLKNATFFSLKITVDTLIEYSSLQLMANCIVAKRCLRHHFKLI